MHGVIATYERVYFMIGIVYSSKTGNTQSLENFDEALKHPNDKDVDSLMKCVNEAL